MTREVMQQALETMETNKYTVAELAPHKVVMKFNDAITALREALAQPVQEPDRRAPLTEEYLWKLADKHLFDQPEGYEVSGIYDFARAIEAAHNIGGAKP